LKRRGRKSSHTVAISFAVTIGVLSVAALIGIAFLPVSNGVITKHIPNPIPTYSGIIEDYAPAGALQVSYNDFTAIRNINATALPSGNYLQFKDPKMNLSTSSIEQRISIVLSTPNATIDVTILDPSEFLRAQSAFQSSLTPSTQIKGVPIYRTTEYSTGSAVQTWTALLSESNSFVVSAGDSEALQAMSAVISVYDNSTQSLFGSQDIQRMLYVANGTTGHLGFAIQNFAGAVTSGQATLVTVDTNGSRILINHIVRFSNSTSANSQIGYFQKVYIGSSKYESYDEILLAAQSQPLSSIGEAITLVG
jgi:hypothetical protein